MRSHDRPVARSPVAALLPVLLPVLLAGATACGAPATAEPPHLDASHVDAPGLGASGAHTDLNAPFLAPDVDVAAWTRTFEGESREIATARDAIAATLELKAGASVADIGAGTGLFMGALASGVGPQGTVWAVDLAPKFVQHLAARATTQGLAQVRPVLCTDRSTRLPEASLDAALVCDTYHHFEHPQDTLASLRGALRPGGLLVVVDFERLPGRSRDWVLDHVRAGKAAVIAEIEAAGFELRDEPQVAGLHENYVLRFRRR